MRVAAGLVVSLAFALPVQGQTFALDPSNGIYTVQPGTYTSTAFIQFSTTPFTALNLGTFSFQTDSAAQSAFGVSAGGGSGNYSSGGFTFTNQGNVSLTAPASDVNPNDYRILNLYALGGPGASGDAPTPGGGSGPIAVTINNSIGFNSQVPSFANGIYSVWVQSKSGTGGASTMDGVNGSFSGFAGEVTADITDASVSVQALSAQTGAAVHIEQDGGQGGAGTKDSVGGQGGTAKQQTITLTDSSLTASGSNLAGLVVRQIGGRGGDGGLQNYEQNSSGGPGGFTDGITLKLQQNGGPGNVITTSGVNAPAVSVLAQTGSGGTGADTGGGLQFDSIGGNGGNGVEPSRIVLESSGTQSVTTQDRSSPGIVVVAQGGAGGAGGRAEALSGGSSGSGGGGGSGGTIQAALLGDLTVTTAGAGSPGVALRSFGGAGGTGGVGSSNLDIKSGNGGPGGGGFFLNAVIGRGVTISTVGSDSYGIALQSVGAFGGAASEASGLVTSGGNGGNGGGAAELFLVSAGRISTMGAFARGILAQSISGDGGRGADAAALSGQPGAGGSPGALARSRVLNTGSITTTGINAQGMLVQSIGGGGGAGGDGSGFFRGSGGAGIVGASGGTVEAANTGTIVTSGSTSAGLLAQSIGGGGGDGGSGTAVFDAKGGSGGPGGSGGTITAALGGSVTTSGELSHGAVVQSIGGGGGNSGNATAAGVVATYTLGGTGGGGGAGGSVTAVGRGATIATTGTGADGILAQSIGGGGGAGGAASSTDVSGGLSISAAIGGTGGSGGAGGSVGVNLDSTSITTSGGTQRLPVFDSIGILAQSIGGGGGAGGGANALAVAISRPSKPESTSLAIAAAYSAGGSGATGGNGGTVDVALGTGAGGTPGLVSIATAGIGSHAVMAQSVGGGGGQGGDSSAMAATIGSTSLYGNLAGDTTSVTVSASLGGTAGGGGSGGAVNLTTAGAGSPVTIGTTGDYAYGILGQSIGGGGGNAGIGSANYNYTGNAENHRTTISVGQKGGDGGIGGAVSVVLGTGTTVSTAGSGAVGVAAHSIGGGGGTATGSTVNLGQLGAYSMKNKEGEDGPVKFSFTGSISVGDTGGSGNNGGAASLNNQGSVTTNGNDAPALLVQSIGGGGGVGGAAGNDANVAASVQNSTTPAAQNAASDDDPTNPFNPNIEMQTMLSLVLGGSGGGGGDGGNATLRHGGTVTTSGDYAPGLVVQSIGGGGGRGGNAVVGEQGNSLSSIVGTAIASSTVALGANGSNGANGAGTTVTVDLDGGASVTTGLPGQGSRGTGIQSIGILAQSIGGGGGIGVDGTVLPNGSLNLGAVNGGGIGGSVTLRQSSGGNPITVTTYGQNAHGIVLQSIGGGGGTAGAGSTIAADIPLFSGLNVDLTLGGGAGGSGNGGSVLVDVPILAIHTAGMGAYGLIAQSVGGGGGIANVSGSPATLKGLGGQGSSGNGGSVTVNLPFNASIATTGLGAHALVAQSVGGGGGIATGYQAGAAPVLRAPPQFGSGSGTGGNVSVQSFGTITTTGAGAFGIIAQSVARGGGLATIGSTSYAAAMGNPNGSTDLAGTVNVAVQGSVSATGENAVGIFAQSVNGQGLSAQTVTVSLGGSAPASVTGGTGQGAGIWVESGNAGNSIGIGAGSSVTALSNLAINYTGGSGVKVSNAGTITGSTVLGSGTLTNQGTVNASATGAGQAVIAGDFVQTSSGRLRTRVDFVERSAGQFTVTGDARLAGTIQASLASVVANVPVPILTVQGQASGSLTGASTALFDFSVQPTAEPGGQRFDLVATGSRLSDPRFSLTPGRQAVAGYLDRAFAAGTPQFGTLFTALDRIAESPAAYQQQIGQLGPRSSLSVGALRAQDAAFVANAAMSCPVFASTTSFLTEGNCSYARLGGRTSTLGNDADRALLHADATFLQAGGQGEVAPGWFLGGALAYEAGWLSANDGVHGLFDVGHGVVTLKRQEGPWLLTGAVFGSVGNIDLRRTSGLIGFGGVATGSTTPTTLGGRVRAAYTVGVDEFYLRPFVNLDVIHARLGAYSEQGLGGFGLRYEASEQVTAVFTPALEVGMRTDLDAGLVLRSFVTAGVDIRSDDAWRATTRLIGAPAGLDGFTTAVPQARAAARVSAGVQLFAGERLDLRAQYDGSVSDRFTNHAGFLTLSYRM